MKKIILFTFFILVSSFAWGIECNYPQECITKASDTCQGATPKFLGTDECLKCGCHDGGSLKEINGYSYCCKNNYSWNGTSYSTYYPAACDCPNGGEKTVVSYSDGSGTYTTCCKDNYEWKDDSKSYTHYDPKVCGCPAGGEKKLYTSGSDTYTICCKDNYEWSNDSKTYAYIYPKGCGCPNGGEVKETTTSSGATISVCCKNGFLWISGDKDYTVESPEDCGCSEGKEKVSDGTCCEKKKVIESGDTKTCCEHDIATRADGGKACCKSDEKAIKPDGSSDEICCNKDKVLETSSVKACCTDDEKIASDRCCKKDKVATKDDGTKECCADDEVVTDNGCCKNPCTYKDANGAEKKKCCSEGQIALNGSGECCTDDKKYPWRKSEKIFFDNPLFNGFYLKPESDNYYCCEGDLYNYITYIVGEGRKPMKQCCNNGYTPCASKERGVVISMDQNCRCGCFNNWDCNINWKEGDVFYKCQSDQTCEKSLSFDISGIQVEIEDFAGGKFTVGKAERLVRKIREDLLASTGNDKVKIIFSGTSADPALDGNHGYSMLGDKLNLHINVGTCKDKTVGEIVCSATIVHENVHRVDNVNQPMWNRGRKEATRLYQSCLTEIHAQARGALTHVRTAFEICYRYKNGNAYPVCGPRGYDKNACLKCKEVYASFTWGQSYASKYINSDGAQKYYSDPSWVQDNNCNGLQAQLEEDFANSPYAEESYWKKRRKEAQAMINKVPFFVEARVSEFKNASFLDAGLFGMPSRLGFKWNDKPSPALVSDIAKLYSENATLCMSPSRFMTHPAIQLGFETLPDINKFEEAYDFVKSNPECGVDYDPEKCQEKLSCVTDQWRNGCWPVAEWASHIGEIETYTVD